MDIAGATSRLVRAGPLTVLFAWAALPACSTAQPLKTLHSFVRPGIHPYASVILGMDGNLYGTTHEGGSEDWGTVFTVRPDGTGFRLLHSFNPIALGDGTSPFGGLIQTNDGNLYGTTYSGAVPAPDGVIFKINPDGTGFQAVHSFVRYDPTNGASSRASLTLGQDGALYGTTLYGGAFDAGTIFRVAPDGSDFQILHSFNSKDTNDGFGPYGALAQASDGKLYGTTPEGGVHAAGTVFKLNTDGTGYAVIHSFDASTVSDGANPQGALLQGSDGSLYGTTADGGAHGRGTLFKISTSGSDFQLLHSFDSLDPNDGSTPEAALISGGDGYFYGTTFGNGATPWGTVFKIRPDGTGFQNLHTFIESHRDDGGSPNASLALAPDGSLYGTTLYGGAVEKGTVFKVRTDGTAFALLYSHGTSEGAAPNAVLLASDGMLYGTAFSAGGHAAGSVFRMETNGEGFEVLHSFDEHDRGDGAFPAAGLLEASDHILYGTTEIGGTTDEGAVYKLHSDGTAFQLIWPIPGVPGGEVIAGHPYAALIQGNDGALYGTAMENGLYGGGFVFRIAPDGSSQILHSFGGLDGAEPVSNLILGSDGNLYGTTESGGDIGGVSGVGAVFRVGTTGNNFQTLHTFSVDQGAAPKGAVLQAPHGLLYGMTSADGFYSGGSLFRVMPDGSDFEILHMFNPGDPLDGAYPYSALIEGSDGYFYGTTSGGGALTHDTCNCGDGTIFRISSDGSDFQVIYSFSGSDGAGPVSLVQASNGDFFGTTVRGGAYGAGTVFTLAGPPRLPVLPVVRKPIPPKTLAPR